jgi:chromosomal replication initiation ATPase DnaA
MHHEIIKAQDAIKQKTGIEVTLLVRKIDTDIRDIILFDFFEFFKIWNIDLLTAAEKTRAYPQPIYRSILWMFCKIKYPKVSLKTIGSILGGFDHTTVIYGVTQAYKLLEIQDQKFLEFYNPVKHLIYNELDETI